VTYLSPVSCENDENADRREKKGRRGKREKKGTDTIFGQGHTPAHPELGS
jgi:hypothetical protein